MSSFDPHGFWLFGNDGTRDEEEQEKEHQEELCRLMEQYHAYLGILKEKAYVFRGSKIGCQYGTKENVLIDIYKDYGVVWGMTQFPVVTIEDCRPENIHHFGYCKCPETQYAGRLPMTKASWGDGEITEAEDGNIFPHICVPLIKKEQKWKQIDEDLLIEVGQKKVEPALLDDAVLVCQYGGIIRIVEVPDVTEEEQEELEWIPTNPMQLNGNSTQEKNLKERVDKINESVAEKEKEDSRYAQLYWDQDKINIIWEKCRDFYDEYEVQIDPRMLIAIVAAEGTGSFDTSSTNKAADGGNGVQFDFETDCINAIDLLGGKIIAYPKYCNDFKAAVQGARSAGYPGMEMVEDVDILHYLNWETPRLLLNSEGFESGEYAADNRWHSKVRYIYSELVDLNVPKKTGKYTDYILTLDESIFSEIADEKGIEVDKQVRFENSQNGADEEGNPNGEYTVVGVIYQAA